MRNLSPKRKLKSLFWVTVTGIGAYGAISFYKNNEIFYKNFVMPLVHLLDPEDSHRLGIFASKYRLIPKSNFTDPESLRVKIFNKNLQNPVGIAAGYDKNAEAISGLTDLGFGFIEIGSVTPEPQPGNPKPRVFRLPEDGAVINRYGFNSDGHEIVFDRLIKQKDCCDCLIGVNLGKNKNSPDAINDYVQGVQKFGPIADYLVINISSPNTPGLRSMQEKNILESLLENVIKARNNLPGNHRPPLLLKLAPDLNLHDLIEIAKVINDKNTKVDGLIISNTTIKRPQFLKNVKSMDESGGLSGKPLRFSSTKVIAQMYNFTNGEIPIIGVGGIFTGADAYEKIKAGASCVQIYTSLVYEGPPVVTKIKKELAELLANDGYRNISEAVGANVK